MPKKLSFSIVAQKYGLAVKIILKINQMIN